MSRVIKYSNEEFDLDVEMDIHDASIPLVERLCLMLISHDKCSCDDFLCTNEELAVAMNEIEKRPIH